MINKYGRKERREEGGRGKERERGGKDRRGRTDEWMDGWMDRQSLRKGWMTELGLTGKRK